MHVCICLYAVECALPFRARLCSAVAVPPLRLRCKLCLHASRAYVTLLLSLVDFVIIISQSSHLIPIRDIKSRAGLRTIKAL